MPVTSLDLPAALVLVDLQRGITAMPAVHPVEAVLERCSALAAGFREAGQLVVRVRVGFSRDGGDAVRAQTDAAPPASSPGPDFSELDPRVPSDDSDLVVTKRGWDAFHGTELDLQLRRRGVRTVVLAGISTSIGVEGTARSASALGYELAFASDAMTDLVASAHEHSSGTIFPRIGRVDDADAVLAALAAAG